MLRRRLLLTQVQCPYSSSKPAESQAKGDAAAEGSSKKRLREELCTWTGAYGDLTSKHLAECDWHAIECPRGCTEKVKRMDMPAHERNCSKNLQVQISLFTR